MSILKLQQDQLKLDVTLNGGCVTAFTYNGRDVLRRAISSANPLETSAFPMVPFSGRIANGRFSAHDHTYTLPANMPPETHAIHGFGWQSLWSVEAVSEHALTIAHTSPKCWPFKYLARQHFELTDQQLTLTLSVTNQSARTMPAGIGWHPYFNRADAVLTAATERVWLSGDDMIPAPSVPVGPKHDLRQSRNVETLDLDNAFDVSQTHQTIVWPDMKLVQRADPLFKNLIVYVPQGQDFFCVEPASHAPDAINSTLPPSQTGLRWIAPEETLSGQIRLDLYPR